MNMIQSDLEAAERRSGGAVGKLADLREKVAKAKALKEEADSLLEAEGEIKRLQAKILWRHVHEEEVIVEKQKDVIATAEKSLATATAALQRAESQEVTGDMESTKTELAQVGLDLDAIGVDVEAKVKEFREKQREGNSFEKSLQEAKAYKADSDKRLVRVRKQIAELRQVALKDSEGAEREALEGIAKTTQNISNAETKQRDLRVEKESLLEQYASGQKESNIHHKRGTDLANEISRIDSDLQSMNSSQDKAAMFGQKIPAVLRQISQTRFQGPVIGPLGMHIKLKEGFEKYQVPVEKILGVKVMSSFAVTTNQDRALLHEILAREKLDTWTTIHKPAKLVKYDNVAASPAGITTILDCIIAENPLVFNTLIDVVNVETIAIVASKEDARALTKVHNGSRMFNDKEIKSAVLIDGSRSLRYQNGNEAFESVSGEYKRLLVKDFSDAIAHQRVVLQEKRNELNEIKAQHKHQESVLNELKRQSDGVEAELRKLVGNIRELNRRKQDFENSLSEAQATKTIDTSDLEAEESETVDAIASIDRQVVDVNEEYLHFKNKLHAVKGEKETVERRQQELKKTRDQLEDKLSHFVDNVQKLQREVAKHKTTVAAKQREYDVSVKDLERKTSVKDQVLQKAESETAILLPDWDGRPISARETIDKIQRELDNQKNLLERGKAKAGLSGKTLDAIRKEYEVAKKRLEDEEVKYNKLIQSINDLKTDMDMRKNKWIQTLQKNSKLVDRFFKVFCAAKGWRGGVKFEHKTKELRLVVQTDAKDNTTRHSDVRQMSGGERSYTTLCLLLALGHVVSLINNYCVSICIIFVFCSLL